MNKHELESRIQQIKISQEQLKGQFSTLQGHLDEATFWLKKLDEPVDAVPAEAPAEVQEVQIEEIHAEQLGDESAVEEGSE